MSDEPNDIEQVRDLREKLLARAERVLADLNAAKAERAQMKSDAFTLGKYAPPSVFREVDARVKELQGEHQKILRRISVLSRRLKEMGTRQQLTLDQHFVEAARDLLEPDVFAALWREATARRSSLAAVELARPAMSALPVASTGGGMRTRRSA